MNNSRDFKGVWIPKEIWLNPDLLPLEKLFLAEIDSLDNDEAKGCFASNEYFGEFFRITEGSAANVISGLKKRGYVFQVFFDGRNRGLRVHPNVKAGFMPDGSRFHLEMKAGLTHRGKQVSRKGEHNNTVYNKVNNKEEEENAALSSTSNPEPFALEAEKQNPIPPVAPSPLSIELHDPETPGVTIYDHIPHKGYPTTEPVGEWQRVNVPQEIEALKTDTVMRLTFTMSRKIPSANYTEYLDAFLIDVQGRGETYTTAKQLKSHFLNWSGRRFEIQCREAKESKPATPTGQPAKIRQL